MLARDLVLAAQPMAPDDSTRPGSTPIIRVDQDTITYRMWITAPNGGCDLLVLRCHTKGDLLASISFGPKVCNGFSRL